MASADPTPPKPSGLVRMPPRELVVTSRLAVPIVVVSVAWVVVVLVADPLGLSGVPLIGLFPMGLVWLCVLGDYWRFRRHR